MLGATGKGTGLDRGWMGMEWVIGSHAGHEAAQITYLRGANGIGKRHGRRTQASGRAGWLLFIVAH